MKRISTRKNSFLKRLLINIPFVLIVTLTAACFFGGAILIFYCFVTAAAFRSAMISLILVGAGLILICAGLGLILAFKRYYVFYDKQMGWEYPDRKPPEEVTTVDGKKPLKAYFSLSNIALALLLFGAIFTIASAALGCIDRDKWVEAVAPYREAHGYYGDVSKMDISFPIEDSATHGYTLKEIDIDLISKNAVIHFTDEEIYLGLITVNAYFSYEDQVEFALRDGTFSLKENPAPETPETTLDKLLFFAEDVLRSVPSESRIQIYLPLALKDEVEINGDHIIAKA